MKDPEMYPCRSCGRWFLRNKRLLKTLRNHDCDNPDRHPYALPFDLQMAWCSSKISEEEAWKISDDRIERLI